MCAGSSVAQSMDSSDDWTASELRILASLTLASLGSPPNNPSNRVADDKDAGELGKALFFDQRLSGDGKQSCASCHIPDLHFTDGLPRSKGAGELLRNAPTVVGSAYQRWFYWDGRRDSLWSQALIPIESQDEMGSSRIAALRLVFFEDKNLREMYEKVFGEVDPEVFALLPDHAGPFADNEGRSAWFALSAEEQRSVNKAFANLGKALEAYQRTLMPVESRFDRYVAELLDDGASDLLTADEIAGLSLFIDNEKTQCLQCHNGPLLTNGDFHNIGTGVFSGERLDFGREIGLRAVLMDEFNCVGPYSDAKPMQCRELLFLNRDSHLPLRGAFKVPSLRSLDKTAPYFHDGRFDSVMDVIHFYNDPPEINEVGPHELRPLGLAKDEIEQIAAFLATLSAE